MGHISDEGSSTLAIEEVTLDEDQISQFYDVKKP